MGNKKIYFDNIKFDSLKEASRYRDLKLLQKAGVISDLKLQVKFELLPSQKGGIRNERPWTYTADFTYMENGKLIIEDTKGYKTIQYVITRKMMKSLGHEVTET